MPAQSDAFQKPARRSRRLPRKSMGAPSPQLPSDHDVELSTDTGTETQSGKPTRILRRGEPDTLPNIAPIIQPDTPPPHTPPRPKSMYAGSAEQQQPGNGSPPESSHNKRKIPKPQSRKQSGQASPMPMMNGTPISTPRRDSAAPRRDSVTPNRTIETPSKAYAGPTFHASPAASSLPMPKFYSKSVPNVDKTKSLKTMMEQEAPDSSSGSEESPAMKSAQVSTSITIKEESPLDIFFRADREAKGRTGSAPNIPCGHNSQVTDFGPPSGLQAPDPHHSRNNSDGGMFALEMDGAVPEVSSSPGFPGKTSITSNRPASAATKSSGQTEAEREEQRVAQTIALKKLLYSPRPQISHNSSASQRPPSSKLRRELSMPTSPERIDPPELPGTPTPSRVHNPTTPANNHKMQEIGYVSPYSSYNPAMKTDQGHNTPFTHDTANTKSIEDDLRRILKMDVLGGDGATELRS